MDKVPKKPRPKPRALTSTEEKILSAFGELFPFGTANDISHLLHKTLPYVRNIMTGLAGGADDYQSYLYWFGMPNAPGNFERIYTLGRQGREYLRELGIDVYWRYRPQQASPYSFSFLKHHLSVTQFLVALHLFVRHCPEYRLGETRTGFALASQPPRLTLVTDGQETTVTVIPDIWVHLIRTQKDPSKIQEFGLWIEIDCGTEAKAKFQQLVRERINLIRYKGYEAYFGIPSVLLCYLAVGTTMASRLGRLHTMCQWTAEVLTEQNLADWAAVFRFSTIDEGIYDTLMHWTDPVWYMPDADTLVPLFPTPQEQEETHGHRTTTPHC